MGEMIEKATTEKILKNAEQELTKNYMNGYFG